MKKILISWIGRTDLNAVQNSSEIGLGPIAQAVQSIPFNHVVLISDYPEQEVQAYAVWLQGLINFPITLKPAVLTSPTNFSEICKAATDVIKASRAQFGSDAELTFHLSPGTPAMPAVWILLAKDTLPGNPDPVLKRSWCPGRRNPVRYFGGIHPKNFRAGRQTS